jgi:hypothetical protein
MKNIKIYLLSLLLITISFSCDDTLDINKDPLAATSADPNVVLPYVIVQYSARSVSELGTRITDVSQQMSANFNSPLNGGVSSFLTGNAWSMMYALALGNLKQVEEDARTLGATGNNVAAIAEILSAMVFYDITSIWEDGPFTQALDGQTYPAPVFDNQETILRGVVAKLDDAMMLIDNIPAEGVFNVNSGDMIYGGDMTRWRKFANSLKIRVLMMIRNRDTSVDSELVAALSEPVIDSNDDVAMLIYSGQAGAQNAYHGIVTSYFGPDNQSQQVHGPSEVMYDLVTGNNDPRASLLFYDPNNGGGNEPGTFPDPNTAVYSNNIIRPDFPDVWFTPAEISFYRAELALKGVTNEDAQEMFDLGMSQVLSFYGQDIPCADGNVVDGVCLRLSTTEIDNYINSMGAVTENSIYEQQYLEALLRPVLAWNTVRRNAYPELPTPPASSITTYLKRFTYPPDETSSNPNTPVNKTTDTPMWFEKQ